MEKESLAENIGSVPSFQTLDNQAAHKSLGKG